MRFFKLFLIFFALCACIHGFCCCMELERDFGKTIVLQVKKNLKAKVLLSPFFGGDYGVEKTSDYFYPVIPDECSVSIAKFPLRSSKKSVYQDNEIRKLKEIYDRTKQGETVIGAFSLGIGLTSTKSEDFVAYEIKMLQVLYDHIIEQLTNRQKGEYLSLHDNIERMKRRLNRLKNRISQAEVVLGQVAMKFNGKTRTVKEFFDYIINKLQNICKNPFLFTNLSKNTLLGFLDFEFQNGKKNKNPLGDITRSKEKCIVLGAYCWGTKSATKMCAKHAKTLKNLGGVFLEAPMGSIREHIDYLFFYVPACARKFLHRFYAKYFLQVGFYDKNGIQPIDMAKNVPDVPVLFVISQKDRVIPSYLSVRFARKIADAGHNSVYVYLYTGKKSYFCNDIATFLKRAWNIMFCFIPCVHFTIEDHHGVANQGVRVQSEYKNLMRKFIALCADEDDKIAREDMQQYKKTPQELAILERECNSWMDYTHNKTHVGSNILLTSSCLKKSVCAFLLFSTIFLVISSNFYFYV